MILLILIGVVRVDVFESVFPFSRKPVAKTLVALTNHRQTTGKREYGQKVFSPPGGEKTRKPVQKNPSKQVSTCTVYYNPSM